MESDRQTTRSPHTHSNGGWPKEQRSRLSFKTSGDDWRPITQQHSCCYLSAAHVTNGNVPSSPQCSQPPHFHDISVFFDRKEPSKLSQRNTPGPALYFSASPTFFPSKNLLCQAVPISYLTAASLPHRVHPSLLHSSTPSFPSFLPLTSLPLSPSPPGKTFSLTQMFKPDMQRGGRVSSAQSS